MQSTIEQIKSGRFDLTPTSTEALEQLLELHDPETINDDLWELFFNYSYSEESGMNSGEQRRRIAQTIRCFTVIVNEFKNKEAVLCKNL